MSLAAPLWLLALLPVAVAAVLLRQRGDSASRLAWALRTAAAAALVLALAQPQTGRDDAGPTVLVLDRSASIGPAASARQAAWVRAAIDAGVCATPCRVVEFAARAAFAGIPASGALPPASALGTDATDLAAAVRLATGALPHGGRAVVLSDGFDTAAPAATAVGGATSDPTGASGSDTDAPGDLADAATAARAQDVRIDTVALPPATAPDAAVTRLAVPSPLRSGDALTLQATVRSTVAGEATLVLRRDGGEIGREAVTLRAGDNPLLLTYRAPEAGWHAYRLAVELPQDRDPVNDALDATSSVGAAPRALVVEGAPGRAGALPALLRADGIEVETTAPAALGPQGGALASADVIVLADVPVRALSTPSQEAIGTAVRTAGSGLLVLGGEHSLSLGGYAGTPLDALLPLQSLAPGGVRRRRLALELVLDRSSSMNDLAGGYDAKIAMARAAARSALALTARDEGELGVVAFDAVAHDVVPLERATAANAGAIGGLIDSLDADGGTNVLAGLERGVEQVSKSSAPVRHVILLSDGVSERADYEPLLARLRRERITLSTIALGQDADVALMRRLARAAGGRAYVVPDARSLPRVFARETRRSAPSVGVRATLPVTAGAASPLVSDLSGSALPPLRGTVLTRLRAGAVAPLTTTVNGATTPLLGQWQQGLGRVVVWAPGAGSWAGDWLASDPAATIFGAAARWSERALAVPALEPRLQPGAPGTVVVDPLATAGRTLGLAQVDGTARAPDGTTAPLAFEQVAPSRYVAALPVAADAAPADSAAAPAVEPADDAAAPAPGVHGLGISADDPALPDAEALVAVPYPAEHLLQPADAGRLGTLASVSGGRALDAAADARAALEPDDGGTLWRIPLAAAIVLLLAAVAAERLRPASRAPRARPGRRGPDRTGRPRRGARPAA